MALVTTVNYCHKEIYYRYYRGPRYASETRYYKKFENEELQHNVKSNKNLVKQFSWGAIFQGAIFLGGIFPGGNFLGGLFPGGNFPGGNFLGGIFAGRLFSRGHFSGHRNMFCQGFEKFNTKVVIKFRFIIKKLAHIK